MIGAVTFASTTHSTVLNVENRLVNKSAVITSDDVLKKTQSCTVTVTIANSDGSISRNTATYTCETCTPSQACAGAYAAANSIIVV